LADDDAQRRLPYATLDDAARSHTMATQKKSTVDRLGAVVSDVVSDTAAHPFAQLGMLGFCIAWFALGLSSNVLSVALAILAILLTQMVLNKQNEREADADRRDLAMHAKLDELLFASGQARNEMAGIEDLEEEEILDVARRVRADETQTEEGAPTIVR
jgi:low affinity Fe/Cu permease